MNWQKINVVFTSMLFVAIGSSCKKESVNLTASISPGEPSIQQAQASNSGGCRLNAVEWPLGTHLFQYNADGLCTQIQISDVGIYQQQYNAAGKLQLSKFYSDGFLQSTIVFQYSNGMINKETRYEGSSTVKTDEITISRNNQGRIVKMQSTMNDYVINAQYSPQGNNIAWQLYISNKLAYDAEISYRQPMKNQYSTVNGIDYGFPLIDGFKFQSKFTPAAEKLTIYDEFGNGYLLYDYDADLTTTIAGSQNYPVSSDWYDTVNEGWRMYNFYYSNCGAASARQSSGTSAAGFTASTDLSLKNLLVNTGLSNQSLKEKRNSIIKKLQQSIE